MHFLFSIQHSLIITSQSWLTTDCCSDFSSVWRNSRKWENKFSKSSEWPVSDQVWKVFYFIFKHLNPSQFSSGFHSTEQLLQHAPQPFRLWIQMLGFMLYCFVPMQSLNFELICISIYLEDLHHYSPMLVKGCIVWLGWSELRKAWKEVRDHKFKLWMMTSEWYQLMDSIYFDDW